MLLVYLELFLLSAFKFCGRYISLFITDIVLFISGNINI